MSWNKGSFNTIMTAGFSTNRPTYRNPLWRHTCRLILNLLYFLLYENTNSGITVQSQKPDSNKSYVIFPAADKSNRNWALCPYTTKMAPEFSCPRLPFRVTNGPFAGSADKETFVNLKAGRMKSLRVRASSAGCRWLRENANRKKWTVQGNA